MGRRSPELLVRAILAGPLLLATQALAAELSFESLSVTFTSFRGIDFFEPANQVVVSDRYPNGVINNFARIAFDGSKTPWSTVTNIADDVKIATVRSPARGGWSGGPFAPGTLFAGNGNDGEILKIDPAGVVTDPWATMPTPAPRGVFRGSLYVDRTGLFGGDLIGTTTTGKVYRVNGAGVGTLIANTLTPVNLKCVTVVPNDVATWGSLAGRIIAVDEGAHRLYAFNGAGGQLSYVVSAGLRDLDWVIPGENFFGVNYGSARLLGAEAAQFAAQGLTGKLIAVQQSPPTLHVLSWNSGTSSPQLTPIAVAAGSPAVPTTSWEQVTFAPAGVAEIPTTDVPVSEAGITTLAPPWPNPARSSVLLAVHLERSSVITIEVFDLGGRRVRVIESGLLPAGASNLSWDGLDENGSRAASAVYFIKVSGPNFTGTQRVVLTH